MRHFVYILRIENRTGIEKEFLKGYFILNELLVLGTRGLKMPPKQGRIKSKTIYMICRYFKMIYIMWVILHLMLVPMKKSVKSW